MVDLMLCNRLEQLQVLIEKLHLSYLHTDESLQKIEQRKKLESFIKEYLCLVPHNQKFLYRETADVLHRSAASKEDFSAYRAASAWNAIATYASNLLSQPWRKEYKELKLFCGFYKHEVEASLVGAESMLTSMGYRLLNQTTMILEGPIDPDKVSNVSRDSLVAFVECQLMKNIWEEVSSKFNCGWFDILQFRESHICSPSTAIRTLVYKFHQHQYQEQQQQQQILAYHHHPTLTDVYGTANRYRQPNIGCLYGQTQSANVPYYYPQYVNSHSYTVASEPRYGGVIAPQHAVPYSHPVSIHPGYHHNVTPVLKSHDLYPVNGHQHYIPSSSVQNIQVPLHNGYSMNSQASAIDTSYPVPTGKLIELDTTPPQGSSSETLPTYSATDSSSSVIPIARNVRNRVSSQARVTVNPVSKKSGIDKQDNLFIRGQSIMDLQHPHTREDNNITFSQKAKEDGIGTFESWDYVFKDLESQGYNKDLGERPDILSRSPEILGTTLSSQEKPRRRSGSIELEKTLQKLRMDEFSKNIGSHLSEQRNMKINEAWQRVKSESEGSAMKTANKLSYDTADMCAASVYDNMSSPPRESPLRERPITFAQASAKPVNSEINISKSNTKTLPRDLSKRRDSEKFLRVDNYTSTTLDPRKLRDCLIMEEMESTKKGNRNNEIIGRGDNFVNRKDSTATYATVSKPIEARYDKNKWQCKYCTYLNIPSQDICEMCHKSKSNTEIPPLATGGRECPKCTLVNEKGLEICEVCGSSLKDSPTYI